MDDLERFASEISRSGEVQPTSNGFDVNCPGPNHKNGDQSPSLSIAHGGDKILMHCKGGCSTKDILSAAGKTESDLFIDDATASPPPAKKKLKEHDLPKQAVEACVWSVEHQHKVKVLKTSIYQYHNADGSDFGIVVRCDIPGDKVFKQIKHLANGKWQCTAGNELWPLYRLTEMPKDGEVYLHEGEKAACAGAAAGLPSIASKGGSEAPDKSDWKPLAGMTVNICPDNDKAGEKYAATVTGILQQLVPPATVKIVRLDDRPEKGGDFADILAACDDCKDEDVLAGLRQEVEQVADETAPEKVAPVPTVTVTPADKPAEAVTPYPTDAFPEDIKNYIEQSAASICCEPVMVANPLLSALSTVAGGINDIEVKPGWVEPLILWTMVVADSGSKKSPAFKAAMAPLEAIESVMEDDNIDRKKNHQTAQHVYDSEVGIWKSKMRDASKPKKGQAVTPFTELPPTKPEDYVDNSVICTDVTIEQLGKILSHNKNGVMLAVDEASSWIDGFDRYGGGGEVGKWLSLHSGSRIRVDRVGRGRNFVDDPRLCVAGGIQPWVLAEVIGKKHVANGLFQRFLVAQPKKVRRQFDTPSVDPLTSAVLTGVFEDMRLQATRQEGFNLLRLSPEAVDVYKEFYERHADKQDATEGAEAGMLAKIEGEAARLAGVLYTVKVMLKRIDGFGDVDADCMAGGIALAEWYASEWERLYRGQMHAEPDPDEVLLDYLVKHGGKVKRSNVMRNILRYRKAEVLDAALAKLKQQELISIETERPQFAGRPCQWVVLNN